MAAHTPTIHVLAGGGAGFDPVCEAAIAACGYDPKDFGDYDYVRKRCAEKRAMVKAYERHEAYKRGETLKPPYDPKKEKPPASAPTAHDRFLAESESGHITQNATQMESGADRADTCANLVDGWNPAAAPCMPHHGSTDQEGTMHCIVSRAEENQPRARGLKKNDAYDPKDLAQDRRARIETALQMRRDQAHLTVPMPADPDLAAALAAAQDFTLKRAADCIEAFSEKGDQAMKADFEQDGLSAENAAEIGKGKRPGETDQDYHQRLADEAAAANAAYRSAAGRKSYQQTQVNEAREEFKKGTPGGRVDELNDLINERGVNEERDNERLAALEEREGAAKRASAPQRAKCKQEQAQRLAQARALGKIGGPPARNNPRCPGRNRNLPEHKGWKKARRGGTP